MTNDADAVDKATDVTGADWANEADMVTVSEANEADEANEAIAIGTDVTMLD
jgi:hypothetical protein